MIPRLKYYQCVLRTIGPVFVGSGKEIGKREYVFLNQSKVGIPNIQMLYAEMKKRGLGNRFEDYMLGGANINLTDWLKKQNITMKELEPLIKYTLDCRDVVLDRGTRGLQVMGCIKDPYGKPYVPGSTLKGMFRTILLGADIMCSPEKFRGKKQELLQDVSMDSTRTNYLRKNADSLEQAAYRTLHREGTRLNDAVNDILQGFVVSDSEPLDPEALVLCQKIDLHTKGIERRLPLLRECVKPGTEIKFSVTMDTDVCPLTVEKIMNAVKQFSESYYKNFGIAFHGIEIPKENEVFLGGGCGFVSKTVLYPLLGREKGMKIIPKVFEKTKVPRVHKHIYDQQYGASPHTLKCTKYRGKNYQMGLCRIESLECVG